MGRLYRSMAATVLGLAMMVGCGSTSDDGRPGLVMQFQSWDSTNIEQQDSVNDNSANVDITPSLCATDFLFTNLTFETFTETIINAIFLNQGSTDILLQNYRIHFDDPRYGLGDMQFNTSGIIQGGRCSSNATRSCATADDCLIPGQMMQSDTCDHSPTTLQGLLLFDFLTKQLLEANQRLLGQATSITVTFVGANANKSFEATASYVVTFDDFCNCDSGSFCVPPDSVPGS